MANGSSFLDNMVLSKKSPSVLRLTLLKIKRTNELVFIFEGKDDYSYYEHALRHCDFSKKYEHINGEGKEQLTTLWRQLLENKNDSKLLDNTYFFVDQDYDDFSYHGKNIYNLPCYSIENMLLDDSAIDSVLKDEFNLDAEREDLRLHLIESFRTSYKNFSDEIKKISYVLFFNKKVNSGTAYPKFSEIIERVEYNQCIFKVDTNEHLKKTIHDHHLYHNEIICIDLFLKMNDEQIIRGKYILAFIQEWFESAKKHINNNYADRLNGRIKFGKDTINIRRLSQSCTINKHLKLFTNTI